MCLTPPPRTAYAKCGWVTFFIFISNLLKKLLLLLLLQHTHIMQYFAYPLADATGILGYSFSLHPSLDVTHPKKPADVPSSVPFPQPKNHRLPNYFFLYKFWGTLMTISVLYGGINLVKYI